MRPPAVEARACLDRDRIAANRPIAFHRRRTATDGFMAGLPGYGIDSCHSQSDERENQELSTIPVDKLVGNNSNSPSLLRVGELRMNCSAGLSFSGSSISVIDIHWAYCIAQGRGGRWRHWASTGRLSCALGDGHFIKKQPFANLRIFAINNNLLFKNASLFLCELLSPR